MDLLDNQNVLKQRDPSGALLIAAGEWNQLRTPIVIENRHSASRPITKVVVTGMGGSALAAGMAKDWLNLTIPFEVVRAYALPNYVDSNTLVVASSYSGNTEETVGTLQQAVAKKATVAVLAASGAMIDIAQEQQLAHVVLQAGMQPRMAVFANLRALITVFENYGLVSELSQELSHAADALENSSKHWVPEELTATNPAKQLALKMLGKTPVIYASNLMRSVAYKWKISFNENAKNVAFMNELPEFNHNEFIGWASHPVQKPFGVIDLRSSFDHPQVTKRFKISDRLLSGQRPAAIIVQLEGRTILEQMLWGFVLADYVSIYLAVLNGVDPTPVVLVEKLKKELA